MLLQHGFWKPFFDTLLEQESWFAWTGFLTFEHVLRHIHLHTFFEHVSQQNFFKTFLEGVFWIQISWKRFCPLPPHLFLRHDGSLRHVTWSCFYFLDISWTGFLNMLFELNMLLGHSAWTGILSARLDLFKTCSWTNASGTRFLEHVSQTVTMSSLFSAQCMLFTVRVRSLWLIHPQSLGDPTRSTRGWSPLIIHSCTSGFIPFTCHAKWKFDSSEKGKVAFSRHVTSCRIAP